MPAKARASPIRSKDPCAEWKRKLKERDAELEEAREQQAATSEVLKVISSSPGDLQPVLDTIAERAARLCNANDAQVFRVDGDFLRMVTNFGSMPSPPVGSGLPISRGSVTGRAVVDRCTVHVLDLAAESDDEYPEGRARQRVFGHRTTLATPLLREGVPVGAILIRRIEVQAYTTSQIQLLETFAAQAVIAIENVRLFNETKEALEQQTVISQILRVISSSPTNTQPVFDAIVKAGVPLFGGMEISLRLVKGDYSELVASTKSSYVLDGNNRTSLDDESHPGARAIQRHEVVQIPNIAVADEWGAAYKHRAQQRGFRAIMSAPLLRENKAIGAITVTRAAPGRFSDKQVALFETFADQAVIAIENVRLFKELQARNAEVTEALEQQTATAEILKVISSSPTDIQPVFDAIAESAARFCSANDVVIRRIDGDALRAVAHFGSLAVMDEAVTITRGSPIGRAVLEQQTIHIHDTGDEQVRAEYPATTYRHWPTMAVVPLLREHTSIGTIVLRRPEVHPFSDKQIRLLETFAAQAVIAIENVRLFNETKEALEQQTATAEILKVISSSPTNLQPVFDAILESAMRLCDAHMGNLSLYDGDKRAFVAQRGGSAEFVKWAASSGPVQIFAGSNLARLIAERRPIQIVDLNDSLQYRARTSPGLVALVELAGARTFLVVPMIKDGSVVGGIAIYRLEVRPFTQKQIDLVSIFANQAVIAIENVRLFKELEARNAEVTEALRQQTATAEILQVISSSPTDTQPVFDAILEGAARLCDSHLGTIGTYDGKKHQDVAVRAGNADVEKWVLDRGPFRLHPGGFLSKVLESGEPIELADLKESTGYRDRRPFQTLLVEQIGVRTLLSVPMLKEGRAIGTITIYRVEVRPFTQKEIDLVVTFANQAVIAIENVRLFKELQARNADVTEALEQQTATAEILRVISSSPTNLQPVFDAILENATRLCDAHLANLSLYDNDKRILVAQRGASDEYVDWAANSGPMQIPAGSGPMARAIAERRPIQIADLRDLSGYRDRTAPALVALVELGGARSHVIVPMVKEGRVVGGITIYRPEVRPFMQKQIDLLTTFANQAVIAIDNVRLFNEIQDKSRQLEIANRHKSEFLANMSHELRTPLNAVIGFSEVLQQGMVGDLNDKQGEYIEYIHKSGSHLLSLINDILDLSKVEAGRMELDLTNFNVAMAIDNALTLVKERATRHGLTLDCTLDPAVADIHADERKFKQVMLNLLSNAVKFTSEGGRIMVAARPVNDTVEVSVTDTGIGIAPEDCDAVFEEFRQVGRHSEGKAEGTGLGLALARKFIELHGGRIWLTSILGQGSTFSFTLPVAQPAAQAA